MARRELFLHAGVLALSVGFAQSAHPLGRMWPPVAALLVILLTRSALTGLLAGGFAGALLLSAGNPLTAAGAVFADHLLPSLRSTWKVGAIVFTLLLGGFAAVLEAGGGFTRLLQRASGSGGDRARRLESAAAGLGLLCFFDGLANSMVVGRVGRGLADRSGTARLKLAYIADSTSSAVACVAILSTWIAFQLSMIREAYALAGYEANPYTVYLASLPYNFYCWFTLVLLLASIRWRFHPGPMRRFVAESAAAVDRQEAGAPDPAAAARGSAAALVPLGVLVASFFVWFIALGSPRPILPPTFDKLAAAFGSDAGPFVLILSAVTASVAALLLFPAGGRSGWSPAAAAFGRGVRTMIGPIGILLAAWILGSVIAALGTAELIAGLATQAGSVVWLPALVFATGAAISFATGTSWGTMGLLFPLAIPAAAQMGVAAPQLPIIVGAVFSGAVFGDHCSPFSDTTIVTSVACGVEPHDHVRTQIPYAVITAAVAVVVGFLPAGLGWAAPWSLIAGVGVLIGLSLLGADARRIARGAVP